jgi:hypothetical protein
MTDRLQEELPDVLRENQAVVMPVKKLIAAAKAEKLAEHVRLAEKLTLRAKTKDGVLYPPPN